MLTQCVAWTIIDFYGRPFVRDPSRLEAPFAERVELPVRSSELRWTGRSPSSTAACKAFAPFCVLSAATQSASAARFHCDSRADVLSAAPLLLVAAPSDAAGGSGALHRCTELLLMLLLGCLGGGLVPALLGCRGAAPFTSVCAPAGALPASGVPALVIADGSAKPFTCGVEAEALHEWCEFQL